MPVALATLLLGVASAMPTTLQLFPATHPQIRVVGRTAAQAPHPSRRGRGAGDAGAGAAAARGGKSTALYFDWSSVYIVARLTGPASILLHEAANASKAPQHPPAAPGNSYLVQLLDSQQPPVRLNTTATVHEYPLPLAAGVTATVRIEKVTEAREDSGGVVRFDGLRAAALHPQPPVPQRRLECIGDSIMCGAHSERVHPFPSDCGDEHGGNRESSHLSWCPVLARALAADYQMECCSGNGLVYTDNPTSAVDCDWGRIPPTCPVMPRKWQQRLMCATDGVFIKTGGVCHGLGGLEPLDVSLPPHAVLINLGQNDYGADHIPNTTEWVAAYTDFVKNISATYRSTPHFFLACGGMADKYCLDTEAAVRSMNSAGLGNVHYLDLTAAGASAFQNGTTQGCPGHPGSHPSWVSHALMAEVSEPVVRRVMGWSSDDDVVGLSQLDEK